MTESDFLKHEQLACAAKKPDKAGLNPKCELPFGLTADAIFKSMNAFCDFLTLINQELNKNQLARLEGFMMQANFSSLVGEFQSSTIPKYCSTIVKNKYHNGHPDLVPKDMFPGDSVKHAELGIEIKGSRYRKGWQGHNAEDCWLMVFVFTSSRPTDQSKGVDPAPFAFVEVLGAQLSKADWLFAGRKEGSRRTITASVTNAGYQKMQKNWIYRDPTLSPLVPVEAAPLGEAEPDLELQ